MTHAAACQQIPAADLSQFFALSGALCLRGKERQNKLEKQEDPGFEPRPGGTLMEQHIFCIFIHYRGRHRKGVAIYNAT